MTMKLTTEQKLEKCVEFIRKIEKMDIPVKCIEDCISYRGYCEECGSEDVDVDIYGDDMWVVDPKYLDELKDEAWHGLADIAD